MSTRHCNQTSWSLGCATSAASDLPGPPLLAVEVTAPSTRLLDLNFKRARLESAGCRAYWVVDPAVPSLTAWELGADGRYAQVGHVEGTEEFTADSPFTVRIVPQSLVSR